MGIRGLMSYLENDCPNAYSNVRIADLVQKCSEETGRRTEIVIDGNACYSMWTRNFDWTIGLQVGELESELKRFVDAFRQIDADLVFFFDGVTPSKKRRTWLQRRLDCIKKIHAIYNHLYAGIPFNRLPPRLAYIPPNMTNFVTYVLKHVMHCKVYVTVHECDEEIVDYVANHENSIIFSYDSDFIVSCIDSYVLSSHHFKIETMTTRMYDRRKLNAHLNLQTNELSYLAIMAGNDVVDRRLLKPFHLRIIRESRRHEAEIPIVSLLNGLAKYITSDLSRNVSTNNHMRRICYAMFGNRFKTAFLRMAHKSYIPNRRSEFLVDSSPWSQVLITAMELMRNIILPVSAWGVLSEFLYESSPLLENYRTINNYNGNPREWPCATITRSLRKRWYGILLFEIRDENRCVVEWCAENPRSYQQSVEVYPEYPSVHHPGLRVLWDQSRSDTLQHKWALFLKAVSPNIEDFSEWMALPEDLVISTAVCYYLFEERFLNFDEVRALVVTLLMHKYYNLDNLRNMWRRSPDFRAIQISVTFSRTYSLIFSLFASCGYPIPLSENIAHIKFEPILFQKMFQEVHARKLLGQLCRGKTDVMRVFHQMKKIIHQSHHRQSA